MGPRILLAEDHRMNQIATQALLESLGYQVLAVADGAEAVQAYAEGYFDLIIMDCQMPGMDGYQATAQIRRLQAERACARTPIIGLSGRCLSGDRDAAIAQGMDAYVTKPPSIRLLTSVLQEWVAPAVIPPRRP
jgi:CheY-like chemotaxis protein